MHTVHPGGDWDTWVLYVLGNGDMIYLVLTGIQALFRSHAFLNLVNIIILMSFGWILCLSIPKGRISLVGSVRYLLFIAIIVRLLFGFSINLGLVDLVDPKNNKVISGIPFLLGAPISFLSQVGYALSKEFDAIYSAHSDLPAALTLTGGGEGSSAPYGVVAHLIQEGAQYRIRDPYLKQSLTVFFLDCLTPMIDRGEISVYALLTSGDVWGVLSKQSLNPAMMTVYYRDDPEGAVKTCSDTYQLLNEDLKKSQSHFVRDWGKEVHVGAAASLFQVVLNYTARRKNYTPTPGNYIQQSALLDVLGNPLLRLMSSRTNVAFLSDRLSMHQALQSVEHRWNLSNALFQKTFGYVYSGLQVVVYALFPMAVLFLIFPGLRNTVLKCYAQLLVWFPVTFILLAIMNDMVATWSSELLRPIWDQYGGLSLTGKAFISERSAKMIAVSNWLMTLAPAFSWVFVRGIQGALHQAMSGSGALSYAHSAATASATGNIALDNQSYDNVSAHSFNTALRTDIGAMPTHLHEISTNTLATDDLGGTSVRSNDAPDMKVVEETVSSIDQSSSAHTVTAESGEQWGSGDQSSHSTEQGQEEIQEMATRLHSGIESPTFSGAAAVFAMQRCLHRSHPSAPEGDLPSVASAVKHVVAQSAEDLHSGGQNIAPSHQVVDRLKHAFHTVQSGMEGVGGGALGAGLVGLGAAATVLSALPEEAILGAGAGLSAGVRALGSYMGRAFEMAGAQAGVSALEMQQAEGMMEASISEGGFFKGTVASGLAHTFLAGFSVGAQGSVSQESGTLHRDSSSEQWTHSSGKSHQHHAEQGVARRSEEESATKRTVRYKTERTMPDEDYYQARDEGEANEGGTNDR